MKLFLPYIENNGKATSYFQQEILIWKVTEDINFILKFRWIIKSS